MLLEELFGGRADDSARSYLRQAIRGLRDALGDDAPLLVDANRIAWTDDQLTSDSITLRRDVQQALLLHGRDRLAALTALTEPGEFLPEARSPWADERREALRRLLLDARLAAAGRGVRAGRARAGRGVRAARPARGPAPRERVAAVDARSPARSARRTA